MAARGFGERNAPWKCCGTCWTGYPEDATRTTLMSDAERCAYRARRPEHRQRARLDAELENLALRMGSCHPYSFNPGNTWAARRT
jgi:hypothetical protein